MHTLTNSRPGHPVLIVGAGPVGLTLASLLHDQGVPTRIVERLPAASPESKALLVWPRTLQVLRQLGGADAITRHGLPVESFRYYSSARQVAELPFDDRLQPVILPQPDVEKLLSDALSARGGSVERGVELLSLRQDADVVHARLQSGETVTEETFSYVVGCDGAGSTVRELLGVSFDGDTYPTNFWLVDTKVTGSVSTSSVHYFCSPQGVLVLIGLPGGRFRVFTSAPVGAGAEEPTLDAMQALVDERGPGGLTLEDPDWISSFAVHARLADRYRVGRVFLAGNAAHVHSPAGGQGLCTGVTDAHNLAWKIGLAWRGQAGEALLATYEPERSEIARTVIKRADIQTKAWVVRRPAAIAVRDQALRLASATRLLDIEFIPWLSGFRARYSWGALIPDGRKPLRRAARRQFVPGALLPQIPVDVELADGQRSLLPDVVEDSVLHTLLVVTRRGRQGHVNMPEGVSQALSDGLVRVWNLETSGRVTAVSPAAGDSRVKASSTFVLVRPDGHIAAVTEATAPAAISSYLQRFLVPTAEARVLVP